ncbi:MAG: guanine deaminase [Chlamydiales bacterium]
MSFTPEPGFMTRAIELARHAVESGSGGPFGAIIAREGEIFAEGYNRVLIDNDPTAHAEVVAIRRACERAATFELGGFELYTSCEPCPMCLSAALWARVDRIVYAGTRDDAAAAGFDDRAFYAEVSAPASERSLPMTEFMRTEAREPFALWTARADRTAY